MPIEELRARRDADIAAGALRTHAVGAGRVRAPLLLLPCANEGAILESCRCKGEARSVRDCDVHERCTHAPVSAKVMDCGRCQRDGLGFVPAT